MLGWVTSKALEEMLDYVYKKMVDFFNYFFTQINNMGADLFELSWIKAIQLFFTYFAWALFVVGFIVAIFDVAIEAESGNADFKATAINILKGFFATSLFSTVPVELYKFCISLQNTFSSGLAGLLGTDTNVSSLAKAAFSPVGSANAIYDIFFVFIIGYSIIKAFMQNIKRGGILLILLASGSLYMFSVPRGYTDGFIQWCKRVVGLCFTAFMQTTLLVAGLITSKDHPLLGLGVMLAANEVERIAESFGLDTSARGNIGGAVHTASTVVSLVKSIKA